MQRRPDRTTTTFERGPLTSVCPVWRGSTRSSRWIVALAAAFLAAVSGLLLSSRPAAAHPLGNFTINRYARLEPGASAIRIVYAVDMS